VRIRERPGPAELAMLPPQLRMYADPSVVGGRGPGMDAYPDRAAWLAARRKWEAEHGITAEDWFREVCSDALRRRGLQAMNEAFSAYFIEGDDDEDARTWTDEQLTAPAYGVPSAAASLPASSPGVGATM
jgi:hypothetical protein